MCGPMSFILWKAIIIHEVKDNMKWYEKLEECELGSWEKYSQYGEEGVLNRIFKNITPSHKYAVEMGAMDGDIGSNTKWLEELGWNRLKIDGDRKWYRHYQSVQTNIEWVTAENINELFDKYKVPVDFDFFSLDIDGVDYWVWKSILERNKYVPKVVLIEYNPYFELNEFKTIRYDANYKKTKTNYYGASISAYKKLGVDNGYKLVHIMKTHSPETEKYGRNAFFIKSEYLPEDFEYDTSHIVKWLEGYKYETDQVDWIDVS